MARIRLDKILIKRNIASNVDESVELIESGKVLVDGAIQMSPNSFIDTASSIELLKEKPKYVSRGGFKLEKAIDTFDIVVKDKRCLDVGASTGGFTDCLLQYGAKQVVAIDVGHGHLDLTLRNDPRVVVFEKTHAKNLNMELIGGTCHLGVMDVSFTSVIPLIDTVMSCLAPQQLVVLIKPQFECEPSDLNAKGIVTNPQVHIKVIKKVRDALSQDFILRELTSSPITGTKGNREYLALVQNMSLDTSVVTIDDSKIEELVLQHENSNR